MSHVVLCPKCDARVTLRAEQLGRRVGCPACRRPFSAPAALDPEPVAVQSADGPTEGWLADGGLPEAPANSDVTVEGQARFRIRCPTCESIQYVTESQIGTLVRCEECHKMVRVPRPVSKPVAASPNHASVLRSQQESETASSAPESSPAKLLQSAEDAVSKDEKARRNEFQTGFLAWPAAAIKIFSDAGVILHLLVLDILLSVTVGVTVVDPRYGFATFPFMAIGASLALTCGLAIVQAVANGEKTVEEWPTIELYAWLESCLIVGSALICSVTPALFFATLISSQTLVTVSMMLCGAHFLFPFFLLSVLETQSVFAPISVEVARSWKRCGKECREFYLFAGSILAMGPMYFWLVPTNPITAGLGAAVCVLIVFLYAAALGRLAYALRVVNAPTSES